MSGSQLIACPCIATAGYGRTSAVAVSLLQAIPLPAAARQECNPAVWLPWADLSAVVAAADPDATGSDPDATAVVMGAEELVGKPWDVRPGPSLPLTAAASGATVAGTLHCRHSDNLRLSQRPQSMAG